MPAKTTAVLALLLITCCSAFAKGGRAKNVILFIGDGGGIPTLSAASIHGHDRPQALFIHKMPHIALSDTSSANAWVSDSAAGMTAIITGQKTNNGMLSRVPGTNGNEDVKTLLEYAEERGLSTGVVTNMAIWDATPGACYAHADSRKTSGEIFAQVASPKFGDGVEILIGKDLKTVRETTAALGLDIEALLRTKGYTVLGAPSEFTADLKRATAVYDGEDFNPLPVVRNVIASLARNPKGFFLMVEWDMHPMPLNQGLKRVLVMDDLIRQTVAEAGDDTLIVFTADHPCDLRVLGGKPGQPLLPPADAAPAADGWVNVRADNAHTGEQVLAAAHGPGAEPLKGFVTNTDIFALMMAAYGWEASPTAD